MAATPAMLTVNVGSSQVRVVRVEGDGVCGQEHLASCAQGAGAGAERFLRGVKELEAKSGPDGLAGALVHRIVHGGPDFRGPVVLDADVLARVELLAPLAPLHIPQALEFVRAAGVVWPGVPQVAVFDTAFFAELPEVASTYAIPGEIARKLGIRRYGFHGITHAAMHRRVCELRGAMEARRVITLQLGSGCSAAAILDGRPVDTSMGFTPLEGLVMATRSGDIDPGIILHLTQSGGMSMEAISRMLSGESGLLGISGISGDMRELLASRDPAADLAIGVFCHRIRKHIGAGIAVLGGLDILVFGGGIGSNSPEVRRRILAGLGHLGLTCHAPDNAAAIGRESMVSNPGAPVDVWAVVVNEAGEMAREAASVLPLVMARNSGKGN